MHTTMKLDKAELARLKESFQTLAGDADRTTMELFKRLFEIDPKLRFLFPEDLQDQKNRLMSMIGFIVRRLDHWEQVEPRLRNLGRRHLTYGVRASDYGVFKQAMLDVLTSRLELADDSEVIRSWALLFDTVSDIMMNPETSMVEGRLAIEPA